MRRQAGVNNRLVVEVTKQHTEDNVRTQVKASHRSWWSCINSPYLCCALNRALGTKSQYRAFTLTRADAHIWCAESWAALCARTDLWARLRTQSCWQQSFYILKRRDSFLRTVRWTLWIDRMTDSQRQWENNEAIYIILEKPSLNFPIICHLGRNPFVYLYPSSETTNHTRSHCDSVRPCHCEDVVKNDRILIKGWSEVPAKLLNRESCVLIFLQIL